MFFVNRTNYRGNRSILKVTICRTDERDCWEVIAGNRLSSNQLFAGGLCGGPGAMDLGCSSHGRVPVASWLQTPPAATCALASIAAFSFRPWYVPKARYPRDFYFSHIRKLASSFLRSSLLRKKKSISFISPDFLEMGLSFFLARILAVLCKYRYSGWSWTCLLITSLKQVLWFHWLHMGKDLCSGRTSQREGGGTRWWSRHAGMSVHRPLHEKVSVSQLKRAAPRVWRALAGRVLPRRGWRSRGAYPEEHTLKRGVSAVPPSCQLPVLKVSFLLLFQFQIKKKQVIQWQHTASSEIL